MGELIVYSLVDPRTSEVRYVGLSSSGLRRPKKHQQPANLAKDYTHKGNWIRQLHGLGLSYLTRVLEEVGTKNELPAAEQKWIALGRDQGWPLTNITEGGEGSFGWVPTLVTRARMSAAQRGRTPSDEARARMSASWGPRRERGVSDESRAKMSAAQRGRKTSDETRARLSAVLKGRQHSEEHKARNSASHKGHKPSDETRARLREARRGFKHTDETKAKLKGRKLSDAVRAKMSAGHMGSSPRKRQGPSSVQHGAGDENVKVLWPPLRLAVSLW
jgi:hypothetical protein